MVPASFSLSSSGASPSISKGTGMAARSIGNAKLFYWGAAGWASGCSAVWMKPGIMPWAEEADSRVPPCAPTSTGSDPRIELGWVDPGEREEEPLLESLLRLDALDEVMMRDELDPGLLLLLLLLLSPSLRWVQPPGTGSPIAIPSAVSLMPC